ncbi:MAG: 6-pyruvoyl trahydropterin synthase family protein [Thermoplasmataceae archaeon]
MRFSAAHFIPDHDKCSRLHGHDYGINVTLEGELKGGILADFGFVKKAIRDIVSPLDHKLLIPVIKKYSSYDVVDNDVIISYGDIRMTIPLIFVSFVDTETSSSEELSTFVGGKLKSFLNGLYNLSSISVSVQEGPGQGAIWSEKY